MAGGQMRANIGWRFNATSARQTQKTVLFLQQAIEDLQCEEEKVNLLTKEKAKLKLQAEDVSTADYSGPKVNACSIEERKGVIIKQDKYLWPCVVLAGVSTGAGEEAEDGFGEEQKEVGRRQ